MIRCFQLDDGRWVDVLFQADEFAVDPDVHRDEIAAALDVDPDTVQVVEADDDPRTGDLVALPAETPSPPEPTLQEVLAALLEEFPKVRQAAQAKAAQRTGGSR